MAAAPERELPLLNSMRQLDSGKRGLHFETT